MSIIALASARGAPGVTTTAHLLAAQLGAALVEADLSGGVLAARYRLGREPGLVTLAAAGAYPDANWVDHAQDAGGVATLVGPDAPDVAAALWLTAGERILQVLGRSTGTTVVDVGRMSPRTPVIGAADAVVLLARPTVDEVVGLSHAVPVARRATRAPVDVVLVGDGPYRTADIERGLGCRVITHLPDDPGTAQHLRDGGSSATRVARSRLARAVSGLAATIQATPRRTDPIVSAS